MASVRRLWPRQAGRLTYSVWPGTGPFGPSRPLEATSHTRMAFRRCFIERRRQPKSATPSRLPQTQRMPGRMPWSSYRRMGQTRCLRFRIRSTRSVSTACRNYSPASWSSTSKMRQVKTQTCRSDRWFARMRLARPHRLSVKLVHMTPDLPRRDKTSGGARIDAGRGSNAACPGGDRKGRALLPSARGLWASVIFAQDSAKQGKRKHWHARIRLGDAEKERGRWIPDRVEETEKPTADSSLRSE